MPTASRPAMADRSEVFLELIKPRITIMVLLTVAVGYFSAVPVATSALGVLHVLIGTALSCSGSGALNQYLERDVDLHMDRTRFRPLPAGRISTTMAAFVGVLLSLGGVFYLSATVGPLAAALNALTILSYLFLYTPMKRVHPLSTLAGAVPGALPPVIGWAAASGEIGAGAIVLFAILFLWQVPHFLAIGWMYRDDYAKAGFPMLVVIDRSGDTTARLMFVYAVVLVPVSLLLVATTAAGHLYFWSALAAGGLYVHAARRAGIERTRESARRLLLSSVVYLPVLFLALFVEHAWRWFHG
ncbi:MAG TPA: heme o synthase [Candidatus Limnocylindrales bacterium]|nr:heme o synthase [Candidatus Limnocylindrales bacterium]